MAPAMHLLLLLSLCCPGLADSYPHMDELLAAMEEKLKAGIMSQLVELKQQHGELATKVGILQDELDRLSDLPYEMVCSHKREWATPDATITYDYILSEYNNSDRPGSI